MPGDRLTLKEMCAKFDVTTRTLRYYEYIELLFPEKEGRTRYYGPTEFARMELILRGKRWEFSLEEIRQWLELYYIGDQQRTQMTQTYDLAVERLAAMKQQRAELDVTITEFEKQLQWGANFIADLTAKEAAE